MRDVIDPLSAIKTGETEYLKDFPFLFLCDGIIFGAGYLFVLERILHRR